MISVEKAHKKLEDAQKIIINKDSFTGLSKSHQALGVMLSRTSPNLAKDIGIFQEHFGEDYQHNPWQGQQGEKLAQILFGPVRSPYISDIWELINVLPYQRGYYRRSFRCKTVTKIHLENKIIILQRLVQSGKKLGFAFLPLAEQIQYNSYRSNDSHAFLFAIVFNHHVGEFDELVTDIINAEDDIGGISRELIKGMLLSCNEDYWHKVGQLLLAAQRQEGLRQTILECLDETQVDAIRYFAQLILDHDLMRFSSVVRAVDTWFGFGWDAPKKNTIQRILQTVVHIFDKTIDLEETLKSQDCLQRYVALWFVALSDVDKANHIALDMLYNETDKQYRLLALFFVRQTERTNVSLSEYMQSNCGHDIELDYWMMKNLPRDAVFSDEIFHAIKKNADALPVKGKKFEARVFSWMSYTITPYDFYHTLVDKANDIHLQLLAHDISLIPSDARNYYLLKLFPEHHTYGFYGYNKNKSKKKIDLQQLSWKRSVAHQAIQDRNMAVMATGINIFKSMDIESPELDIIDQILSKKNKDLRTEMIMLLLDQDESTIKTRVSHLLQAKNINQRLAGLEILTMLKESNQFPDYVQQHVNEYGKRSKINKNEQVMLDKMVEKNDDLSFANGFGVIDYNNLSPLITPQRLFNNKQGFIKKILKKTNRPISQFIDEDKTVKQVNQLIALLKDHKDYEYTYLGYNDQAVTTLLSDEVYYTKNVDDATAIERLQSLPLFELWDDWYQKCGLNGMEMVGAIHYSDAFSYAYGMPMIKSFLTQYIPDLSPMHLDKNYSTSLNNGVKIILECLFDAYVNKQEVYQIKADLLEDAIAAFPENKKHKNLDNSRWKYRDVYWYDALDNNRFLQGYLDPSSKRIWDINRYLMAQSLGKGETVTDLKSVLKVLPEKDKYIEGTNERMTLPLYHAGEVSKDDVLLEAILTKNHKITLDCEFDKQYLRNVEDLNPPFEIFKPLKNNLLAIELQRGDIETEASGYIHRLNRFIGMHYLFEVLERMGKSVFERGYSYDTTSKTSTFSYIIKNCYAADDETYEAFANRLKSSKISKKRLLEVACYAAQWSDWIGRYLKIDQLTSAVWWFHAHSSDYMSAEKETVIARYSKVPVSEFSGGSLDIDWFYEVYANLGKTNWKLLHDASKYIGSGHAIRQVKLYSQVLLKETKITETIKKIKDKRDQIYVRALGLIPLSKANPSADVLKRYNLLQSFLKESKQFGAQRQESEKNAVTIGLENLSRNAGYSDSIRLSWAMESQAAEVIMNNSTVTIDEVVINLIVDDQGKAQLTVNKKGKNQKSIPAKLRKNKEVLKLKENKSYLSKQYSRTRQSLENAMLDQELFTGLEITNIMQHPVVKPMLQKLVLINKEKNISGFWQDDQLRDHEHKLHTIEATDQLIIAHPSHLHANNEWSLFQHHLFEQKIVQPFKQVFRELYVITDDEKEQTSYSKRYAGHQIQPKKTAALLRSRGWTLNYEEGLQKVYHKQGFMASMYAMADWYSPSDIEAPTLEYVCFHQLRAYELKKLVDIDPIIFSEVMRDVDLVVSVAHVGGVDPEASHSTMEMRAVLAKESARLFKLDNVEVKKRHILIKGTLADYSIHLGSANVSRDGLALSIIPVHSQHRGRMFLPFVDDDPKSAEIISKMKMLAEDDKIKDPTVLAQISKG